MIDPQLRIGKVATARNADSGAPSATYAAWLNTVREGFYQKPATAEQLEELLAAQLADARVLTGVWDDSAPGSLVDPLVPVATYATFSKTLNIGAALLRAHLVTSITVRPTHRRRGILRELLGTDLARAKAAGNPVAVLTATEATIYGRFGFGQVTEQQTLHLDVRGDVRFHAAPSGKVVVLDAGKLAGIAPGIFERFHQNQLGSVGRQEAYWRYATGAWGPEGPEPDPKHRAAVHLDTEGRIDGYVTYAFTGWDPKPITLEVRDLVATTALARRELFRFLALHDLIERVSYPMAAADDPLPWALEDPARVSYAQRGHCLWVRVLDVPAAFAARNYNGTGSFTLRVEDPMGLTGGCYGFGLEDGRATVSELPEDTVADVSCNVSALGPLLLGAVGTAELAGAGLLDTASEQVLATLAALLDIPGSPHAINEF